VLKLGQQTVIHNRSHRYDRHHMCTSLNRALLLRTNVFYLNLLLCLPSGQISILL